jgi:hypothetical protein
MTCAQFLEELNDFLDEAVDGVSRAGVERHVSKCSDCRLIWHTTKQTVRIFKGLEPCAIPRELELRLLAAVKEKANAAAS